MSDKPYNVPPLYGSTGKSCVIDTTEEWNDQFQMYLRQEEVLTLREVDPRRYGIVLYAAGSDGSLHTIVFARGKSTPTVP